MKRERERGGVGVNPPLPPPSLVCCCLLGRSNIWHCLSPGLLVQTGRGRLKGERSANLRSSIAGLNHHSDFYKLDQLSVGLDIISANIL